MLIEDIKGLKKGDRYFALVILLLVLTYAGLLIAHSGSYKFLCDDFRYIKNNDAVKSLSFDNIRGIFSSIYFSN